MNGQHLAGGCRLLTSLKKMIMSITGILVIAAATLFLLFFPAACGKFGCSHEPTWWPIAAASNDCPESLNEAASALEWAAEIHGKLDAFDGSATAGWLFVGDARHEGDHVKLWSGVTEPRSADDDPLYLKARDLRRQYGLWPGADTHVELKAVAYLVNRDDKAGTLIINHPRGPCDGCIDTLNKVLPAVGVELTVYFMTDGSIERRVYPER